MKDYNTFIRLFLEKYLSVEFTTEFFFSYFLGKHFNGANLPITTKK
jgi:hypothetical protein